MTDDVAVFVQTFKNESGAWLETGDAMSREQVNVGKGIKGIMVECWQFGVDSDRVPVVLRLIADRLEKPGRTLLSLANVSTEELGRALIQVFVDCEHGPLPTPENDDQPGASGDEVPNE